MKRGSWSLMDRFEIPNLDDPTELYLTRWRIIETPFFAIFLHRMTGPDSRPTLHDHPWSFVSFILRGGYREIRLNKHNRTVVARDVRFVNVMHRDDAHFISDLIRTPTWTLLFVGARRRLWGYWERDHRYPDSWTWTPFNKHHHSREFDRAMNVRRRLDLVIGRNVRGGKPHAP